MKYQILQFLPGDHPWQNQIYCHETVDSTNNLAKSAARNGAPHGTVILANHQTGGRGRMGRSFHSPSGSGIYMSIILRPQLPAAQLMHLTCAAAVTSRNAIMEATGLDLSIKWTNDLVFNRHKIGGILTELSFSNQNGAVDYAIVGIGINCTQTAEDFPEDIRSFAGSLAMFSSLSICRERIIAALIEHFSNLNLAKKAEIMTAYRQNCITLGQDISLLRNNSIRHGHAMDVDEDGGLIVLFTDGEKQTVQSGEVSVRGMYGYL